MPPCFEAKFEGFLNWRKRQRPRFGHIGCLPPKSRTPCEFVRGRQSSAAGGDYPDASALTARPGAPDPEERSHGQFIQLQSSA